MSPLKRSINATTSWFLLLWKWKDLSADLLIDLVFPPQTRKETDFEGVEKRLLQIESKWILPAVGKNFQNNISAFYCTILSLVSAKSANQPAHSQRSLKSVHQQIDKRRTPPSYGTCVWECWSSSETWPPTMARMAKWLKAVELPECWKTCSDVTFHIPFQMMCLCRQQIVKRIPIVWRRSKTNWQYHYTISTTNRPGGRVTDKRIVPTTTTKNSYQTNEYKSDSNSLKTSSASIHGSTMVVTTSTVIKTLDFLYSISETLFMWMCACPLNAFVPEFRSVEELFCVVMDVVAMVVAGKELRHPLGFFCVVG